MKEPLTMRLHFNRAYTEVARLVSYGGLGEVAFWDQYRELCKRIGQTEMSAAVDELIEFDKTQLPAVARLKPSCRKSCRSLLGPAPEDDDYADYWKCNGTPPANHLPQKKEEPPKKEEPQPERKTRSRKKTG